MHHRVWCETAAKVLATHKQLHANDAKEGELVGEWWVVVVCEWGWGAVARVRACAGSRGRWSWWWESSFGGWVVLGRRG